MSTSEQSTTQPEAGDGRRRPRGLRKWWPWLAGLALAGVFATLHLTGVLGVGNH
jgi:hypothetical protein